MFFWNSLAFSMIQQLLAIWSLVPLPFLKPAWTSESSRFTHCCLENFEHYFTSMWDECNCAVVWGFFGIPFLGNLGKDVTKYAQWKLLSLLSYGKKSLFYAVTLYQQRLSQGALSLQSSLLTKGNKGFSLKGSWKGSIRAGRIVSLMIPLFKSNPLEFWSSQVAQW